MSIWNSVPQANPDPIFATAMEARAAGPNALDATIGVYMNESGSTPLLPSVKSALHYLQTDYAEGSFGYASLLGLREYRSAVTALVCADAAEHVASCASAGGTGALALNLRLLKLLSPGSTLLLPSPSWSNHAPLCAMASVPIEEFSVIENGMVLHERIVHRLKEMPAPRALLLQVGCHNPTGIDMHADQWTELIDALKETDCTLLLDFAYQGFADIPENDAAPVRACMRAGIPVLVSWSASKNHTLYTFRTGVALVNVPDDAMRTTIEGHYSSVTRGLWSSSPSFGQELVACTQTQFHGEWLSDLADMRMHIKAKRFVLENELPSFCKAAVRGNGMFAMLPLSKEIILTLRKEHGVYLLDSGRMNIAGIPKNRLAEFCEKVRRVCV